METVEVTFINKNFFFQSDDPEAFRKLSKKISSELDQLMDEYPSFSREQLLLLHILRHHENPVVERDHQSPEDSEQEELKEEQLGVDLDEIDEILNIDI